MKKALIIIIVVLMIPEIALLVYGAAFLSAEISTSFDMNVELVAPDNPDRYAAEIAEWIALYSESNDHPTLNVATNPSKNPETFAAEVNGWFDVFGKADPSTSIPLRYAGTAELVPNLILPVTYNHNRCAQYCMLAHYELSAGSKKVYCDKRRVRYQPQAATMENAYLSLTWTGNSLLSPADFRTSFGTQKLVSDTTTVTGYENNSYVYHLESNPTVTTRPDQELEREVPWKAFDMLCIPIWLGGGEDPATHYYATVDSYIVDGSSVRLAEPTEEKPYYVLTFSEDLVQAQRAENKEDRLNRALGKAMKNITIKKADFVVEIWECGLFRQITANFDVDATVSGNKGAAKISMTYRFVYDDYSCDIVRIIDELGWRKFLNRENRKLFDERKRDYSLKNTENKE